MKEIINDFLREKRRFNLPEVISKNEIKKLKKDWPFQKIIGFMLFKNDLKIDLKYKVLIPRYETEEVIIESLKYIENNSSVLDLCCGSGFIGLYIKKEKGCNVTLSDISKKAIKQTKKNSKINSLDVKVIKSNLFKKINQKFDLIISNPPYIPLNVKLSKSVLKFEPYKALFAKNNGNYFYEKIINEAKKFLNENGTLIFEISNDNSNFLKKKGFIILQDINNKERIAIKKMPI